MKRMVSLLTVSLIVVSALQAQAQNCSIGAYVNADGTGSRFWPTVLQPFEIHIVLFSEDVVNAAAYKLQVPDFGGTLLLTGVSYGPDGTGLGITIPLGSDPVGNDLAVGLGSCEVGFGSLPILVTSYQFLALSGFQGGWVNLFPSESENPLAPVYSDCQGVVKECSNVIGLHLDSEIPNRVTSMSAIRSMYN